MRLPASAAILGKGLDMKYEDLDGEERKQTLRGYLVCGDVDGKTIWILPASTKKLDESPDQVPRAAELRKRWSKLEPDNVQAVKPRTGKDVKLGTMLGIGYRSDKWQKDRAEFNYQHDYDHLPGPTLTKSGEIYRIAGAKQKVTPRGITG